MFFFTMFHECYMLSCVCRTPNVAGSTTIKIPTRGARNLGGGRWGPQRPRGPTPAGHRLSGAETSKPKSKNPETTTGSLGLIMFFSHTILRPVQARSQCASARTSCRSGTGPSPNSAAGGQLEERRRTPLIKDANLGVRNFRKWQGREFKRATPTPTNSVFGPCQNPRRLKPFSVSGKRQPIL